jgi:hypothetical protein
MRTSLISIETSHHVSRDRISKKTFLSKKKVFFLSTFLLDETKTIESIFAFSIICFSVSTKSLSTLLLALDLDLVILDLIIDLDFFLVFSILLHQLQIWRFLFSRQQWWILVLVLAFVLAIVFYLALYLRQNQLDERRALSLNSSSHLT